MASQAEEVRVLLTIRACQIELYLTDLDGRGPIGFVQTRGDRMAVSKPLPFKPSREV